MRYFHFMYFAAISILFIFMSAITIKDITVKIKSRELLGDLEDRQQLFTQNVCKLLEFIISKGYHVTLGEAYRTHEQALIYAKEGLGIKNSLHCERLAVDLNIFTADEKMLTTVEECKVFGLYWETLHTLNRWGGHFKHRPDFDHYEMQDEQ